MADRTDVIVPAQNEIQVFANQAGGVSIRMVEADPHEEDQLVVIPMAYVSAVARRMLDIVAEAAGATGAIDLAAERLTRTTEHDQPA